MCNLLCGQVNSINKLLIMQISLLGRSQDFRNIIYWALYFVGFAFFFPLDREHCANNLSSGYDVKQ